MTHPPLTLLPVLLAVFSTSACTREGAAPRPSPEPTAAAAATPTALSQLPVPAVARRSKWALDPENSSVQFSCKHVFTNVRGMFALPTGTLAFDEDDLTQDKVSASLDVKNLSTGVEERDTHLKSPDFFDLAKFPAITFASTSWARTSPTSYTVTGDVTLHGITKPLTLAVTLSPPFNHAGGIRRAVAATGAVNRKDFGISWEFPGEGPGVVVGDTIALSIDAELVLEPN